MLNWFRRQRNITKKVAGLAEKAESTKIKLQVAMNILEKRKEDRRVDVDRRRKNEYANIDDAHLI